MRALSSVGEAVKDPQNITLFLCPHKPGDMEIDVPWFAGALSAEPDQKGEVTDLKAALPPLWLTTRAPILHELNAADPQSVATQFVAGGWFDENQITHLALIESEMGESDPLYFNAGKVTHNAAVFWYSAPRDKYYFHHCVPCAMGVLHWMTQMQETWAEWATAKRN